MYCDASRLVVLIRQAQAEGRVGEELALMVLRIADGVWARDCCRMRHDQDEFCQDFFLLFLRHIGQIRTDLKPNQVFSYITQMGINLELLLRKRASQRRVLLEKFAVACQEKIGEI